MVSWMETQSHLTENNKIAGSANSPVTAKQVHSSEAGQWSTRKSGQQGKAGVSKARAWSAQGMVSTVHGQQHSSSRSPGQGPELKLSCWANKVDRGPDEASCCFSSQFNCFAGLSQGHISELYWRCLNTWSQIQEWARKGVAVPVGAFRALTVF